MSARPTIVTFPGTVRIEPVKGEKPLKTTKLTDAKGNFKGTRVVLPAGKHLDYELVHPEALHLGRPKKPHAKCTLVDDVAAPVVHAELEHHVEETAHEITQRDPKDAAGTKEPVTVEVKSAKVASVTATSTVHEGLTATAPTAAEAVKALQALVVEKLKKPDDKPAASPTPAADAPHDDAELVHREG